MLFREFCEVSKNTFFTERLRTTAPERTGSRDLWVLPFRNSLTSLPLSKVNDQSFMVMTLLMAFGFLVFSWGIKWEHLMKF